MFIDKSVFASAASLGVAVLLVACSRQPTAPAEQRGAQRAAWVDEERLARADSEPQNWYATDRASGEDHYSPLAQIDESNVSQLGFAWQYETNTTRGLEASPLVIDGVMYTSGNWGKVYAVDAKTGAEIWTYDPGVPGEWARRTCCDIVNRGVAAWKGRIYVASLDGFLIALDAATGEESWRRDTLIDRKRYQTITGAPQIAGDKVVIGNAGAELGVRGFITAYDTATGELAWRFYIVPGDPKLPFEHPEMEMASKTWDPDSMWDVGGGGTAWDAMAYDPELDLLYVGTGNGSPQPVWSRSPKGGDNLFLSSILAIEADTGRLRWYYQTTPGDSWDYTATQHLILTDAEIDGEPRKLLMQAPKNGFFYVLDRATGELLSAEKYGKVNWASHVDLKTGRPVKTSHGDYSRSPKLVYPGNAGAHVWHAMSLSAHTGLVYIPMVEWPMVYSFEPKPRYIPGESSEHVGILGTDDPSVSSRTAGVGVPAVSYLQAWDPLKGEEKWRVTLDSEYFGSGLLSTAGNLVFLGNGQGFLNAYAAETGALLASINVGTGMMAAPISYAVDGEQYIAIMAGFGGAVGWYYPSGSAAFRYGNEGRIVAFKLGGGAVPLPPKIDRNKPIPEPPQMASSPGQIERGRELFDRARCSWCHVEGPGPVPNLLEMAPEKHALFEQIVLGGALESKGMASFADVLSKEDARAIHAFIVEESRKRIAEQRSRPLRADRAPEAHANPASISNPPAGSY
jgi:quinohemoprotein ethanol dehydrogenase